MIYLDAIFIINFFINSLILWTASKFLKIHQSKVRLVLAASAGAFYVVLASLPQFNWLLSLIPKVLLSALMVAINLQWKNLLFYLKYWAAMHLAAFAFGGAVLSLGYLFNGLQLNKQIFLMGLPQINLSIVTAGLFLTGVFGTFLIYSLQQKILNKNFLIPLVIRLEGQEIELIGLVDTGNHLQDPLTGRSVIIVEYLALGDILPLSVTTIMAANKELDLGEVIEAFEVGAWEKRLSIIPFSSVGREHGMMLGFKPDLVVVDDNGQKIEKTNIIIGLYQRTLCPNNSYNALINPQSIY